MAAAQFDPSDSPVKAKNGLVLVQIQGERHRHYQPGEVAGFSLEAAKKIVDRKVRDAQNQVVAHGRYVKPRAVDGKKP